MRNANGGGDRTRTCKPEGGGFQDRCITNYATPPREGMAVFYAKRGGNSMGARTVPRACASRTHCDHPGSWAGGKSSYYPALCCRFGKFLEPANRVFVCQKTLPDFHLRKRAHWNIPLEPRFRWNGVLTLFGCGQWLPCALRRRLYVQRAGFAIAPELCYLAAEVVGGWTRSGAGRGRNHASFSR